MSPKFCVNCIPVLLTTFTQSKICDLDYGWHKGS